MKPSIFEIAKQLDSELRDVWRADGWSARVEDVYRITVSSKTNQIVVSFLKAGRLGVPTLRAAVEIFKAKIPGVEIEIGERP